MVTISQSDDANQEGSGCMSLKQISCDGYEDNDALRMAVNRSSGHLRVHADICVSVLGSASNFAAPSEHNRK